MDAKLAMDLRCGASYEVGGAVDKLKKLKIALARKMALGSRETMDVRGDVFVDGISHSVDVTVSCDQLAGVKLIVRRPDPGLSA